MNKARVTTPPVQRNALDGVEASDTIAAGTGAGGVGAEAGVLKVAGKASGSVLSKPVARVCPNRPCLGSRVVRTNLVPSTGFQGLAIFEPPLPYMATRVSIGGAMAPVAGARYAPLRETLHIAALLIELRNDPVAQGAIAAWRPYPFLRILLVPTEQQRLDCLRMIFRCYYLKHTCGWFLGRPPRRAFAPSRGR